MNSVEISEEASLNCKMTDLEISATTEWPLLFYLATERIEKERINIPVAAFQFWEQKEFKSLLSEIIDKSAFYKFQPEEEKHKELSPS